MKVTAVGLPNRNVGQINYPFIHSVAVQSALPPIFSLVSTLLLSLSLFCFVCLFDIFFVKSSWAVGLCSEFSEVGNSQGETWYSGPSCSKLG